jgi:hypothetical protein
MQTGRGATAFVDGPLARAAATNRADYRSILLLRFILIRHILRVVLRAYLTGGRQSLHPLSPSLVADYAASSFPGPSAPLLVAFVCVGFFDVVLVAFDTVIFIVVVIVVILLVDRLS